ncbi:VTT domain-containing protein [Hyperthermus butylicus]|uniref:Conserved archaeal protein n=1 Tax=Hyperthermus butylicus (strain DSM 5456 / JCM 9403 / PLM1-5) TaxID=415426 RepID=A2BLX7_HYPBU|nr:VTT domain-containing protein [Hyperthermus butylicus]ABM80988.1 conserved archaeal protein [Hyperthermus butylicus DSM 5456]
MEFDVNAIVEALTKGYSPVIASFIISFVFNAIPYITAPYLVVIAGYGAILPDPISKLAVAITGGIGAALGKVVVFLLGRSVHRVLPSNMRENVVFFARTFQKGVFVAVFLFAALPLPDDVLYIPVGMAGYKLLPFFIAVAMGKTLITLLAVLLGDAVKQLVGGTDPIVILALIIASIIVSIIIARINWRKIIALYNERGIIRAFVELIIQVFLALLPSSIARRIEARVDSLLGGVEQQEPAGQHR